MRIDFSRTMDPGVYKGRQHSKLVAIHIGRPDTMNVTVTGINSYQDIIQNFRMYLPAEDLRRIGAELIEFANREGL